MNPSELRPPRTHHLALAILLGVHFVLQLLLILPIALVVFPLVLVAGLRDHAAHERRVIRPLDPPGNQSTRRNT